MKPGLNAHADYVTAFYRERYGDFPAYWDVLRRRMNALTGYGELCNTVTLEEGMEAVYRDLLAQKGGVVS